MGRSKLSTKAEKASSEQGKKKKKKHSSARVIHDAKQDRKLEDIITKHISIEMAKHSASSSAQNKTKSSRRRDDQRKAYNKMKRELHSLRKSQPPTPSTDNTDVLHAVAPLTSEARAFTPTSIARLVKVVLKLLRPRGGNFARDASVSSSGIRRIHAFVEWYLVHIAGQVRDINMVGMRHLLCRGTLDALLETKGLVAPSLPIETAKIEHDRLFRRFAKRDEHTKTRDVASAESLLMSRQQLETMKDSGLDNTEEFTKLQNYLARAHGRVEHNTVARQAISDHLQNQINRLIAAQNIPCNTDDTSGYRFPMPDICSIDFAPDRPQTCV